MSETTRAAFRFVQYLNFFHTACSWRAMTIMCNTLPIFYDKRLGRKIYQDDANLTTVICIDGTGRIQYSNPFSSKPVRSEDEFALQIPVAEL